MHKSLIEAQFERLLRWAPVGALLAGLVIGVLVPQLTANAQAMEPQTYTVTAGTMAGFNSAVLAFAPNNLQIHRGDTVQWIYTAVHNVHFAEGLTDLIVEAEVGGENRMVANPAALFPTAESGSVYQGGDANSGVGFFSDPPMTSFSLVMDVEPGSYPYFCDVHPGMAGSVTVVDDATAVPSPAEVVEAASGELTMVSFGVEEAAGAASMESHTVDADGVLAVSAGLQEGFGAILQFFPSVAVIESGQSVTWTIPGDSMEPHTVTWPPIAPGSEFEPIEQEGGPPILAIGAAALPSVESGSEVGGDGVFSSGIMFPGQSYTLTFTEPGVYSYVCFIHPGMQGTVVVMPQME